MSNSLGYVLHAHSPSGVPGENPEILKDFTTSRLALSSKGLNRTI
jgi:hypothetical protein